jgi:protein-disulfide isomerase/uncharacterized membrane protein
MTGRRSKPTGPVSPAVGQAFQLSAAAPSRGVFIAGVVMLLLSITASIMLVLDHFGAAALPGCGEGSACAKLTAGPWGRVPLINWPIAFVGLAYFAAVLAAWWASRGEPGGLAAPVRWIVRLGALASLLLVGVMGVSGEVCWYCVAAHVGNLSFFALLESMPSERHRGTTVRKHEGSAASDTVSSLHPLRLSGRFLCVFALVTAGLLVLQLGHDRALGAAAERDLEHSTAEILAGDAQRSGFTGRFVYGPRDAAVRIVVFSGYQCPQCRRFESEVKRLMEERDDVSLSVKHFPLNSDCNRHARRRSQPNGCWAALAAEAAGIIGGAERFWEMHFWLIDRGGAFTNAELHQRLRETGHDVQQFIDVMRREETMQRVQEDIEEAVSLGVQFTPMIFINGVELRGWSAQDALRRAAERVAAAGPGSAIDDRPPDAFQKHLDDWREEARQALPHAPPERAMGAAHIDAAVRIDVWGDYLDDPMAELDDAIRTIVAGRDDVRYTFRPLPGDPACNPRASAVRNAMACRAAHAAEAAARLGGADGYWRMHDWLLANRSRFSEALLRENAAALGFDGDEVLRVMNAPEAQAAVRAAAAAAEPLRAAGRAIVFVNERWVPRWRLEGHDVLGSIIEEAAATRR